MIKMAGMGKSRGWNCAGKGLKKKSQGKFQKVAPWMYILDTLVDLE
jgi:hypothetical protein